MTEHNLNGHFADAGDELLETLVKTATKTPASRNAPRERKRSRHSDRKSRTYLNFEFFYPHLHSTKTFLHKFEIRIHSYLFMA